MDPITIALLAGAAIIAIKNRGGGDPPSGDSGMLRN